MGTDGHVSCVGDRSVFGVRKMVVLIINILWWGVKNHGVI